MKKRHARVHAAVAVFVFVAARGRVQGEPFTPPSFLNSQTIAFDAIPDKPFGVSPFAIAAEASSGLPVSFVSNTPGVCKTASVLVELVSVGTCSITASQNGNSSYSAAPSVTRSFTVNMASPSGTLTATSGSPFAAGTNPHSVAVGDFNGDGIPDLAITNESTGNDNVTVLLGNVSGGFTPAPGSPIATGFPDFIAVGDFNGDGYQDLAVLNNGYDTVTVLLGNGLGGFRAAPGSPFPVGGIPLSAAVADFNRDGIQDLVVANANNGNVTVLLGNGLGGFAPATGSPFAVGSQPESVAVGDFNGDGIPDIITANTSTSSNSVTVLLGNGSGGFTPSTGSPIAVGPNPSSVAVGDFNGDGNLDFVVTNFGSSNVTVMLGNGSGAFTPAAGSPFATGSGPSFVAVADFNGDGIPDLAVTLASDSVAVLLGNGSGGFTPALGGSFGVGAAPVALVVADFNGDGIQDLAVVNNNISGSPSNGIIVLLGGKASTSAVLSGPQPPTITFGQAVPLTLTVGDATTAFNAPTGTATFLDGTTVLGTSPQLGSPYTFSASALGVGSHTLTATYSGDARSLGSTSNSITVQVTPLPPCNLGQAGNVTVADVQNLINQALGFTQATSDLNADGIVNVVDIQIEINAAVGLGCVVM